MVKFDYFETNIIKEVGKVKKYFSRDDIDNIFKYFFVSIPTIIVGILLYWIADCVYDSNLIWIACFLLLLFGCIFLFPNAYYIIKYRLYNQDQVKRLIEENEERFKKSNKE